MPTPTLVLVHGVMHGPWCFVPHAAWRTRPVDYIVCRDDSILPEGTQRWLAERANAIIHELPGDHSPFLARPDALVEILTRIILRNAA